MNQPFEFQLNLENEFVHRVIISGELRRGTHLSGVDWQQVLATAKSAADKRKVVFDLADLTYWDTAGMTDIVCAVVEINRQNKGINKRAAIVKAKVAHLFKLANMLTLARRKLKDESIQLEDFPIFANEKELQIFVEG